MALPIFERSYRKDEEKRMVFFLLPSMADSMALFIKLHKVL